MNSSWQNLWGPPGLILIGAILGAMGALWASQQRVIFERDLREKSEEIATLNKKLANLIVGGNSFCYLRIMDIHKDNTGMFAIIHQGEHPLYDIKVRIGDLQKLNMLVRTLKLSKTDNLLYRPNAMEIFSNIDIGNISGGYQFIGEISLGSGDNRDFNIFFTARNGGFTEFLRLRFLNGKWFQAIKVFKDLERDNKILFEEIDEGYPREQNGNINWH